LLLLLFFHYFFIEIFFFKFIHLFGYPSRKCVIKSVFSVHISRVGLPKGPYPVMNTLDIVPAVRLYTVGRRAFPVAAACIMERFTF